MSNRARKGRPWSCAVPYRCIGGRLEFFIVAPPKSALWEFPHTPLSSSDNDVDAVLHHLRGAGLIGKIDGNEPLGEFAVGRGDEARFVRAFLMEVRTTFDPESESHRHRWCLAEEAYARIRRKPLRHLINLAVHRLKSTGRFMRHESRAGSRGNPVA